MSHIMSHIVHETLYHYIILWVIETRSLITGWLRYNQDTWLGTSVITMSYTCKYGTCLINVGNLQKCQPS